MPKGRKPLPTHLKVVRGTEKPSRANPNEPKPSPAIPRPPDLLGKEAKKAWHRTAKHLYELGVLSELDRDALAAFCVQYAIWVDAVDRIQKNGVIQEDGLLAETPNGYPVQHPLVAIINRAQSEMRKWMTEFGMTPSSRTRISAQPQEEPDEFEMFLRGRDNRDKD